MLYLPITIESRQGEHNIAGADLGILEGGGGQGLQKGRSAVIFILTSKKKRKETSEGDILTP